MKPCSPHSQQSTLGGWSVENLQLHWACCRGEGLQRQGWLAAALPTCTWVCLCKDRTGWNEGAAMSITSKWEKQTFLWSVVSVIFSRVTHSLRKFLTRMRATQAKQSHPASGYSVFPPLCSPFPIKMTSSGFAVHQHYCYDIWELMMSKSVPLPASWSIAGLCGRAGPGLDSALSWIKFTVVLGSLKWIPPHRWTWLCSTWSCPAPSGLCVLTTLCRSAPPVGRTTCSRCSHNIPTSKAWLLIWTKSLTQFIMLLLWAVKRVLFVHMCTLH